MVDTFSMARFVSEIDRCGAKLVLVGDERQLQAIELGGAFASIASRVEKTELTEIRRQRLVEHDAFGQPDWARIAVQHMADGNAKDALRQYAMRGLVDVSESRAAAMEKVLAAWCHQGGLLAPQDHVILTGTNLEADRLNESCQAAMIQTGRANGAQRVELNGRTFHEGDLVMLTRKSRGLNVENGDMGRVVSVDEQSQSMDVRLDDGRRVSLGLQEYPHVRLGYACTTHKLQGASLENVYLLMGGGMLDREMAYVQLSRAKGQAWIFTSELEAGPGLVDLVRQASKSHQKTMAVDLQEATERSKQNVAPAPSIEPER
jgi:ATP-dependent exoDNAse (exonuclease V) alpha subunit